MAVLVDAAEFHGKQTLGVFGRHAEQGGNPHPEHGARAASDDCGRHADDVAGADGRGKSGAQSAERRYLAGRVLAFLVFQHVAQGARQLAELQAAQAHGQKNAAEQDEHHQGHAPDEAVDGIEHVVERAEEVFHCSSSISVTFRNFKRPSKRPWRTRAFRVFTRVASGVGATKGKGKAKCDTQMRQADATSSKLFSVLLPESFNEKPVNRCFALPLRHPACLGFSRGPFGALFPEGSRASHKG